MNPSFSSYLVNDVFSDPGIYVEIRWSKRALLFDLGHNDGLGPTRLLRANEIFVSHTHMDHFIGFDAILRVALGRGKTLRLFGPPGLIDNVQGKLRGYTWNLVDGYPLTLDVQEFHPQEIRRALFCATNGFHLVEQPARPLAPESATGQFTILNDPKFTPDSAPPVVEKFTPLTPLLVARDIPLIPPPITGRVPLVKGNDALPNGAVSPVIAESEADAPCPMSCWSARNGSGPT